MTLFDFVAEVEIQKTWALSILRKEAEASQGDLLEILERRVALDQVGENNILLIRADRIVAPYAYTLLYLDKGLQDSLSWWGVHSWHLVTEGVHSWATQLGEHPAQVLKGFLKYQERYGTRSLIASDTWKKELTLSERTRIRECIKH